MLPGARRGGRRPCARACARRAHGRSSSWPSSSPSTTCRAPGLAVLAPNIQSSFHVEHRRHHLRGRYLGRLPGPRHRAHGLAGRPVPTGARSSAGPPSSSASWCSLSGLATNIFVFFLARFGAGVSQASTHERPRLAAGRHLPDQPARAHLRCHGDGHRRGHRPQPGPGGPHRHRGGRAERLALGLLHPGHSDRPRGHHRLPHSRAPPRAVREEGRAG